MARTRQLSVAFIVAVTILAGSCASLQRTDPLQVTVAGIEPMQGQGMELRMLVKLRVQNLANGVTLAQGKVWKTGDPEPAAWTVEKRDPIGHRKGAPGVYADGYADVYFDNLRIFKNQ